MRRYRLLAQEIEAPQADPGLYLVATPIGNLGDMTLRGLEILAGVDVIACEDTRVTRKLADRYGVTTPLVAYHDHNAETARPKLLARLAQGQSVAAIACEDTRQTHKLLDHYSIEKPMLSYHEHNESERADSLVARMLAGEDLALVSDAGTPLISDPGYKLVREAREAGFVVTAVPGASAVMAAVASAGLPTDRFLFEGFLPPREQARRSRVAELAEVPATLVFFESGPRIAAMLDDLAAMLGAREAAVCRELTKLHEEVRRGDLASLAHAYEEGAETRGEFVVVVGPPAAAPPIATDALDDLLRRALATASLKDAVEAVVAATGHKRRLVYQRALSLIQGTHDGSSHDGPGDGEA